MTETRDAFRRYTLAHAGNPFDALLASAAFEQLGKGRRGTVLVSPDAARGTPIVRTTTSYAAPAQCFSPLHAQLAQQIQAQASLAQPFNNALLESYSNAYARMGFHSDQALDLRAGSFIALFSCYQFPERAAPPRALVIQPKQPGAEPFEIPLTQLSVVVFSLATNQRFRHKIVLDRGRQPPPNQWLGLTFRSSATFVRAEEERMHFEDGTPLNLATEGQRREFYALRRRENQQSEFSYPPLSYTISPSDLMPPLLAEA